MPSACRATLERYAEAVKLNHHTLRDQLALLRSREISPLDLLDAHLGEIEARNPEVNAFTQLYADDARETARQQTEAGTTGALAGLTVTIKDCFDIAGKPTYCGSKLRADHRASRDSAAAQRLKAAGAIIVGKTSTPEFLANYESDNHLIGRTNNPLDLSLTPGGSSGGEAAAIAAFMSAGGVGSDGGGSVRWPAHCCGLAGLKPTPGRVSAAGHYPAIANPGGMMGVAGPMARTVADVRLLFEALQGYDSDDPYSVPFQPEALPPLAGIRIGVWPQFYQTPVQVACSEGIALAAKRLAGLEGMVVDEFAPRGLERAPNLWSFLFTELPAPFTRDFIEGRRDQTHWTGTEFLDQIASRPALTGRQVVEVLAARDSMRASLLRQMQETPVILHPAAGMTAFPHRTRRYDTPAKQIGLFEGTFPLVWANLLGLPSLVVPVGGVGVQLIGRPYSEELLLAIGERLEAAR